MFLCACFKGGGGFLCYFQCDFLSEGWTREVAQVSQRKQSGIQEFDAKFYQKCVGGGRGVG